MKSSEPSYAVIFRALTYLCLAALLFAFWRQQADLSRAKAESGDLRRENELLQKDLAQAGGASAAALAAATAAQTQARVMPGNSAAQKRLQAVAAEAAQNGVAGAGPQAAPTPSAAPPPNPDRPRLALAGTTVKPNAGGGLDATLQFSASKPGVLGLVAVAIRLPKDAGGKIIDLVPAGAEKYVDSTKEISADGRFAFFQGTLEEEAEVQFALSVSAPTTVDVRGTRGIGPLLLDVNSSGAAVRTK
jgi:hypothetical protein